MKRNTHYTDAPSDIDFAHLTEVHDLVNLPSPEDIALSLRMKPQKVTITLDADSVDFFKEKAQRYGVKYQAMIRRVLKNYSHQQSI